MLYYNKKEILAMIFALEKFRSYVLGSEVIIPKVE